MSSATLVFVLDNLRKKVNVHHRYPTPSYPTVLGAQHVAAHLQKLDHAWVPSLAFGPGMFSLRVACVGHRCNAFIPPGLNVEGALLRSCN
jgi:hypothetical protein